MKKFKKIITAILTGVMVAGSGVSVNAEDNPLAKIESISTVVTKPADTVVPVRTYYKENKDTDKGAYVRVGLFTNEFEKINDAEPIPDQKNIGVYDADGSVIETWHTINPASFTGHKADYEDEMHAINRNKLSDGHTYSIYLMHPPGSYSEKDSDRDLLANFEYKKAGWNTDIAITDVSYRGLVTVTEKYNNNNTVKKTQMLRGSEFEIGTTARSHMLSVDVYADNNDGTNKKPTLAGSYGVGAKATETVTDEATGKPVDGKITVDKDITLIHTTINTPYDSNFTLPKAPTREGYTFAGWFNDPNGGEKIGDAGETLKFNGQNNIPTPHFAEYKHDGTVDSLVYAHWTKNSAEQPTKPTTDPSKPAKKTYTINVLNQSHDVIGTYKVNEGETFKYPFTWQTGIRGYALYQDNNDGTDTKPTLYTTYYFGDTKELSSVEFDDPVTGEKIADLKDSFVPTQDMDVILKVNIVDKSYDVTLPEAPKRDGYTFDGWYSDPVKDDKVGDAGETITLKSAADISIFGTTDDGNNSIIYAHWTKNDGQVVVPPTDPTNPGKDADKPADTTKDGSETTTKNQNNNTTKANAENADTSNNESNGTGSTENVSTAAVTDAPMYCAIAGLAIVGLVVLNSYKKKELQ